MHISLKVEGRRMKVGREALGDTGIRLKEQGPIQKPIRKSVSS